MKCPKCGTEIEWFEDWWFDEEGEIIEIAYPYCPECNPHDEVGELE